MQKLSKFLFPALFAILCFAVGIEASAAESSSASLSGFVKDKSTGETIVRATVYLEGTKKGTFTNKSGFFSITNIKPGSYTLKIYSIGYDDYSGTIILKGGEQIRKTIEIATNDLQTETVYVEAEREVEKRQISVSKVNIPVEQMKRIRIGGESDIFRTIQMLPGVLTSSQISSGLYIRGGSPDQNLILLDGSTVYNPSHLFGFISTFNSEAIKDVELIKGGYPAEFGSRLSSVLNITQKDGNQNQIDGLVSLGLISSKASLEGPIGNGSWFIGGRRSYFDLVKPALDSDPNNPLPDFGFYDLNGKISQNLSPNDKIFLSGFISNDDFNIGQAGFDMNLFMGNQAGSFRWTHIFGDNLFSTLNFSASRYNNGLEQDLSGFILNIENSINDYTLKGNFEWFASDKHTIKTGMEITNYNFHYQQDFTGSGEESEEGTNESGVMNLRILDWTYSVFAQSNYQLSELLSLQGGARLNYWDLADKLTFDPRVAARYQATEDIAVKASWGIFHQYLRLAGDENISIFDTWLPTDNTINASEAHHYILSFETNPFDDYNLNFDVYYKNLYNISEVNRNSIDGDDVASVFFNGDGRAYGAEIFLQKRIGKFAGWIGYGLGFVYASFDSINGGEEFRPKYDRRHDLKIVAQYELNEHWTFGGTFMFQSGQSYTGATSRFQIMLPNQNYGVGKTYPSKRYGLRLPASHQLNLNASYRTTLFDLPFKVILDIYNAYNRRDILMRIYNTDTKETTVEDIELLPILPTISFELNF